MRKGLKIGMLLFILTMLASCSCSGPSDTLLSEQDGETLSPDAVGLIEDAYENEKIDFDEYLTLRFQEAFEFDTLPKEYATGERDERRDNSFLFHMLNDRFDELDPATQATLEKYILPPDNPGSFWYTEGEYEELEGSLDDYTGEETLSALAPIIDWLTIVPAVSAVKHPRANGKDFLVRYPVGMKAKAILVRDAMVYAHKKYKDAGFPEPDNWVFVQLKGMGDYGEESLTTYSDGTKHCTIEIKKTLSDKDLKATAAHELFHCFQDHYPLSSYATDEWLWESTAVWSEEFTYPKYNTEHLYDMNIFGQLSLAYDSKNRVRHYGAYSWWYYLYQKAGKKAAPIKQMLEAAKKPTSQLQAMQSRTNLVEEYKEWALWMYNTEPYKQYQDAFSKPDMTPYYLSKEIKKLPKGKKIPFEFDMAEGGLKYLQFTPDEDVDRLYFDLEAANNFGHEKMGVQIVYKINGMWQKEDITGRKELEFCRTRPSENIEEIVFIYSNADLETGYFGNMQIDTKETCKKEWHGGVTISWTDTNEWSEETLGGDTAQGAFSASGSIISREKLVYEPEWDEFLLAEQSFSYNYDELSTVKYNRDCGLLSESKKHHEEGSGSESYDINWEYLDDSDAPARLVPIEEGSGEYEIDMTLVTGTGSSHTERSNTKKPCDLEGVFTPGAGSGETKVYDTEYDSLYSLVNMPNVEMVFTLSEDKKKLTGEGKAWFAYDNREIPVTIEAEYAYG